MKNVDVPYVMTAAPAFTGALHDLGEVMIVAAKAAPGQWQRHRVARSKGRSVLVALRLRPKKNRWELCIGNDAMPTGLAEQSRWEGEVRVIQRDLGMSSWTRGADAFSGDMVAATFMTPIGAGDLQHALALEDNS
jgi:hypothetical protein